MDIDTTVIIVGAGMSGLGLAVQLVRQYKLKSFEVIEKTDDVGGTWFVNSYPGCGCDVASHFYSYSFALNPDWTQKFSLQPEIQAYFRGVAERFQILPHIRFRTEVQSARWNQDEQRWDVSIKNNFTGESYIRRCRILVSAVGSLSVPKTCELPGAEEFRGALFHSARWNHKFDHTGKKIIVLGNGCSATQFVPILAQSAEKVTQFARQAQYLAERPNPVYSPTFKFIMRYFPGAMSLYRLKLYTDMEQDFAGFELIGGKKIRQSLKEENERYVKRMAPEKYWNALIPKHEIGCKRKVMDTDYLSCLHHTNVVLIHDDPVETITANGVKTRKGHQIDADAIVLATGFQVARMLSPMEIIGVEGLTLNQYWDKHHRGAPQAYFGTCVPGFKNFFTLMGPNTVTGHLSVIYSVECQINFVLRLLEPILNSSAVSGSMRTDQGITSVNVLSSAGVRNVDWTQEKLGKLVWASGCTTWAVDPATGVNVAMYPDYQFMFWLRSIFIRSSDFEYEERFEKGYEKRKLVVGGIRDAIKYAKTASAIVFIAAGFAICFQSGINSKVKEIVPGLLNYRFR